jgi:integrase/recombinase XerD
MQDIRTITYQFIQHCKYSRNLSSHSIRAYTQDLNNFIEYFKHIDTIECICKHNIEYFVLYLIQTKKLHPRSVKRKIACLSVFFKWLKHNHIITNNPIIEANISLRVPKLLPKYIPTQDLNRLIKGITIYSNNSIDINFSSLIAILLMSCTGIRVGELTKIKMSDIDNNANTIKIYGKGNKERYVYVNNLNIVNILKKYILLRQQLNVNHSYLLLNSRGGRITEQVVRLRIHKLSQHLNKKITPHMLRHTAATLLIDNGMDIRYVQKLLGHQSISTTEIYTHVSNQGLIKALNNANHMECIF